MPVMTTERLQKLADLTDCRPERVKDAIELTELLVDAARSIARSASIQSIGNAELLSLAHLLERNLRAGAGSRR
jgi:hypothetical protein